MNATDYVNQVYKGIKEVVYNAMSNSIEALKENRVIDFYNTTEAEEIFTSVEGITGIEELGDEETPPSLALEDGYKVSFEPDRYGGRLVIDERTRLVNEKDGTIKVKGFLKEQTKQILMALQNKMLVSAFYMFNNGHNGSALTLAPDGVELWGTHTWATGGTFNNSATAAMDADAIDDMEEFGGDFYDPTDTDRPYHHDYDIITVKKGSDADRMARRLFAYNISPISVADINIYKGAKTVVATPYITTANKAYWSGRDSKFVNSMILGINKMPGMNNPITQDNEAISSSVTAFWKRGIKNISHEQYGSDGTT